MASNLTRMTVRRSRKLSTASSKVDPQSQGYDQQDLSSDLQKK